MRIPNASSCTSVLSRRTHRDAIVFSVSTCCVSIAGAGYDIRPFLLEPARLTKARQARAVTSHRTKFLVWAKASTAGAAGSAEAGAAADSHLAAQPRPGRRQPMDSMRASAPHPAAQTSLRPGRRRHGCAMTASARQPAAQPRPGRRRQGCAMMAQRLR